jgi:hypothetical protein
MLWLLFLAVARKGRLYFLEIGESISAFFKYYSEIYFNSIQWKL